MARHKSQVLMADTMPEKFTSESLLSKMDKLFKKAKHSCYMKD
jgi:hypothetical protein